MFIIFGWDKTSSPEGPVLDTQCYHCKNRVTWAWFKVTEWVSFFFIRVIPIRSRHYLVCDICSDSLKLDKADAEGVKGLGRMSAEDRKSWQDYLIQSLEDYQFGDMTETQRNWHRERRDQDSGVPPG